MTPNAAQNHIISVREPERRQNRKQNRAARPPGPRLSRYPLGPAALAVTSAGSNARTSASRPDRGPRRDPERRRPALAARPTLPQRPEERKGRTSCMLLLTVESLKPHSHAGAHCPGSTEIALTATRYPHIHGQRGGRETHTPTNSGRLRPAHLSQRESAFHTHTHTISVQHHTQSHCTVTTTVTEKGLFMFEIRNFTLVKRFFVIAQLKMH